MIYLDHASTTPVEKKVLDQMLPYFSEKFHNPSSLYAGALEARRAIEKSRKKIADFLNCSPDEIIFTSGGTESNNLAILGITQNLKFKGKPHIVTSAIEHPSVLNPCRELEKKGFEVSYVLPNSQGIVEATAISKLLKKSTVLVSLMYANNEVGTIQPVAQVGKIIKKFNKKNNCQIVFHTDACQAASYLDMNEKKLGVDLLTINGSKVYGPKGVGALFVKRGIDISPIIFGGGQEEGLRSGTLNTPLIVGLGAAIELINPKKTQKERLLRDLLIDGLLEISASRLNGSRLSRLANNVNISFDAVEGESAVLYLDRAGIACSTGSACSSKSLEPSHVLLSMGLSEERAHCSLRFTLGRKTTKMEICKTISEVKKTVEKLRKISAL
ncbi:MAG: Cysteine desulfurase [candidate division WS2 bacterium ADurb.Bin280]|uniref:Cysteine desulfurase n=1 Tax=candidate division WS2 bacterium ADurb.Bin280 TaxID=1852829 RepID=A0A1V5SF52_9BACT|nr:MAG: Cysteine desulfurase [candidate division WS2 bacterium ADurb.Bin280]